MSENIEDYIDDILNVFEKDNRLYNPILEMYLDEFDDYEELESVEDTTIKWLYKVIAFFDVKEYREE